SSDVCSSDLIETEFLHHLTRFEPESVSQAALALCLARGRAHESSPPHMVFSSCLHKSSFHNGAGRSHRTARGPATIIDGPVHTLMACPVKACVNPRYPM